MVVLALVMLAQLVPLSELDCHCTVGVGVPVAEAVKVAFEPGETVVDVGFDVMVNEPTFKVAGVVVIFPNKLL